MPRLRRPDTHGPDVILDVIFEDGLLFLAIRNIGQQPAYRVAVTFDQRIQGLDGTCEISALPLFKNIEFLAPGREIKTFLDASASYFGRGEPARVTAHISFRTQTKRIRRRTIHHDLEIYRSIGYIRRIEE